MGLFDEIAEEARAIGYARSTGFGRDDRFWRNFAYSFRLRSPEGDYFFPLVLNPTRYEKTHPFAADITKTQEGGLFVERQGIVGGTIILEGHTGFKPRINTGETGPEAPPGALSGQAHFFRLQDLCFREYSRLVKDHEIQKDTVMSFHVLKDDEHWLVEPLEFKLTRAAPQDRFLYRYTIRLEILGEETDLPKPASEDRAVIDKIGDAVSSIITGQASIDAALSDLTGVEPTLFRLVDSISSVNDDLTKITGALGEFSRGVKRTIALPFATIATARTNVEQVATELRELSVIPLDIVQVYQNIEDSLDTIGTYPDLFVEPFDVYAEQFLELTQGPATSSTDDLELAAAGTITQPSKFRSSALRPGDIQRVQGGVYQQRRVFPRYEGFREVTIRFNDTLQSLASKYLSDARRWVDIAIANNLKAPYISDEGLPGTKRYGDAINIPTLARGGDIGEIRSKGDPDLRASQLEAVLGRDVLIEFGANGRADLVVDAAGGSTDFKSVAGIDNLTQALTFTLSFELGQDMLYVNNGYRRIIGRRGTFERLINAQLSISEAVNRDPRIRKVAGVQFVVDGDEMRVELNATIIDNTQARVIPRVLS
jgi:hypothetical protein